MVSYNLLVAVFVLVVMSNDVEFSALPVLPATPVLPADAGSTGSRSLTSDALAVVTDLITGDVDLGTTLGDTLPGDEHEGDGRDGHVLRSTLKPISLPEESVEEVPRCQQPVQTGMCRGLYRMWYYNAATTRCTKFNYGGCGGNDNNFQTEKHCRAACPDVVTCPVDSNKTCLVSASACVNATCPLEPDAICRVTPCSCLSAFVNEMGDPVQCEEPATTPPTPTPSPPTPTPSPPAPTPSPPAPTPTLTDATTATTTTPVEQDDEADVPWVAYVSATGGVILAATLVLVLWALARHCRLRHKGFYTIFVPTTKTDKRHPPSMQFNTLDSTPGKFKEVSQHNV